MLRENSSKTLRFFVVEQPISSISDINRVETPKTTAFPDFRKKLRDRNVSLR